MKRKPDIGDGGFSDSEVVTAAYRGILGRAPDAQGFHEYVAALRAGKDLEWLLGTFLDSAEFAAKRPPAERSYPLDGAPPLRVELDLSREEKRILWHHLREVWSRLGGEEPYWSVLSAERWRQEALSDAESLTDFYATGEHAVSRADHWLARQGMSLPSGGLCAEFGCGVGRVTEWLAQRFRQVRAFDISEPHLAAAKERLSGLGLTNVEWVLVRGPQDLQYLAGTDFFYSIIVLQHNPPPLILDVLDAALHGLRPNGLAFFQVPTYAKGYRFELAEYLEDLRERTAIEMHVLPQQAIFGAAARNACRVLEVQPDWLVGLGDAWISNTFLLHKS